MIGIFHYDDSINVSHGNLIEIMGTRLDLVFLGKDRDAASVIWEEIAQELMRLDKMLNKFDAASDISKLNKQAYMHPVTVNSQLFQILVDCYAYYEKTLGLFDISLKDFSKVILVEKDESVSFLSPDIALDLGAYAKGYALNMIKEKLLKACITHAFVNFGDSSILGVGHHPYGDSWKVSITNPFVQGEKLDELDLKDMSMSSSGNSPNYTHHIVHPQSGRKNNERKLVCVLAENPVYAEVLSTTFMIATKQEQKQILQNFQIESFQIYTT